jgi:hypothetical protein
MPTTDTPLPIPPSGVEVPNSTRLDLKPGVCELARLSAATSMMVVAAFNPETAVFITVNRPIVPSATQIGQREKCQLKSTSQKGMVRPISQPLCGLAGPRFIDGQDRQQADQCLLSALGKLAAVRPLCFRPTGLYFLPRAVHFLVAESVPARLLVSQHCRSSLKSFRRDKLGKSLRDENEHQSWMEA